MFDKIKALFGSSDNESDVVDTSLLATKGIDLNNLVTVDYPMLKVNPDLKFSLGESIKKITGKSSHSERGDHTHRFYTEDDYFFQFNFFGEDKKDNLIDAMLFQYQLDDGETLCPEEDAQAVDEWRKIIESDQTFTFDGNEYNRITDVLGGLEVVEVIGDDLNTLENTFVVFSREVGANLNELIIVNAEQEVVLNDSHDVVERGDITISIALGVSIPHTQISVNHNKGN